MLSMVGEFQRPLPAPEVVLIGLLVAVVVVVRTLWEIATYAETVVHEGAHVLAGILTGRKILSVTIETNGGGGTYLVPKKWCRVRRCCIRRLHAARLSTAAMLAAMTAPIIRTS